MIQCSDLGLFPVVDYIIPYGNFVSRVFIVFILKFTKVVYLKINHNHYNQNYVQTMASVRF